jgi:aminoglycoside phosphotransferase (APT) family kinase protein
MTAVTDCSVPRTPDDLDADWLTCALSEHHPGIEATAIEILDVHEVTNTHVRVRATFTGPSSVRTDLFVKMPPLDPARRDAIAQTDMGRRESRFYADLAPTVQLRVPACYATVFDADTNDFVIVLEDIVAGGCTISDGTVGVTPDSAAVALEELAHLHARFDDPAIRDAEVPWVPRARHTSKYGERLLELALHEHRDRLHDDFADLARLYIDRGDELQALWHSGPNTVIHGDPHLGNLFDDRGRTGFLDWGIINVSSPMRDVSYFLTMAMGIEDRRSHEQRLLRHYLEVRNSIAASPISFDDAWRMHREQAAYCVPACCQIVVFPDDITEKRRVFSQAFLARAEAAIADLDALAAVRAAGISP